MHFISENEFNQRLLCNRRYNFKEETSLSFQLELLRFSIKQILDNHISLNEAIKLFISLNELSDLEKKWALLKAPEAIDSLMHSIRIDLLNFKSDSINYQYIINELSTQIDLTIDFIFKTNAGAYRGFVFSDMNSFDIDWNPIYRLHYKKLRSLYLADKYINGNSAKLFIIGFNHKSKNYIYNSFKKDLWLNEHQVTLYQVINNSKFKSNQPMIPCSIACPFKAICKP